MFEEGVKLLLFSRFLRGFQPLLSFFGPVGGEVSIHDTHIVNTVRPLLSEVSDEDTLFRSPFSF